MWFIHGANFFFTPTIVDLVFPSVIILPRLMHFRRSLTDLLALLFDFFLAVGFKAESHSRALPYAVD